MLLKDDFFNYLNEKVFTQQLDSPEEYKKAISDCVTIANSYQIKEETKQK